MTEDEAKTKWCAFARVVAGDEVPQGAGVQHGAPTFNRISSGNVTITSHSAKCIASACMAWRSRVETITGYDAHGDPEPRGTNKIGFCGLAGAPQ